MQGFEGWATEMTGREGMFSAMMGGRPGLIPWAPNLQQELAGEDAPA